MRSLVVIGARDHSQERHGERENDHDRDQVSHWHLLFGLFGAPEPAPENRHAHGGAGSALPSMLGSGSPGRNQETRGGRSRFLRSRPLASRGMERPLTLSYEDLVRGARDRAARNLPEARPRLRPRARHDPLRQLGAGALAAGGPGGLSLATARPEGAERWTRALAALANAPETRARRVGRRPTPKMATAGRTPRRRRAVSRSS